MRSRRVAHQGLWKELTWGPVSIHTTDAVAFNEIVRQVSIGCVERGQLLTHVWQKYMGLCESLIRVQEAWPVVVAVTFVV